MSQTTYNYKDYIAVIEDFPEEGVSFKDINTLVREADIFKGAIDDIVKILSPLKPDYIVGPEARGFLMGTAVAYAMGIGFIPIRKEGKLPGETVIYEYQLEYGTDILEMEAGALKKGDRVAIVDDLLATGGTVSASTKLLESQGAEVVGLVFLIELESLGGREKNQGHPIYSLVKYER